MTLIQAGIFAAGILMGLISCWFVEKETRTLPLYLHGRAGFAVTGCTKRNRFFSHIIQVVMMEWGRMVPALASGVVSLVLYRHFEWSIQGEAFLFLCCFLQIAVMMEAKTQCLPETFFISMILVSIPPLLNLSGRSMIGAVSAFLLVGGGVWGISRLTHGGLEGQDVKLTAVVAPFLGLEMSLAALLLAALLCGAAGIVMLVVYGFNSKRTLPFSPFLMAGVLLALLMS